MKTVEDLEGKVFITSSACMSVWDREKAEKRTDKDLKGEVKIQ